MKFAPPWPSLWPPQSAGAQKKNTRRPRLLASAAALGLFLTGLVTPAHAASESASPEVTDCTALTEFEFPSTSITSVETVPSGELSHRGEPVDEHCLVTGKMNERVSDVDDQDYAIGFEMRLPLEWSGQYLYQGNGGLDGAVNTALGTAGGSDSALQMGMAVISSDAGHSSSQNPSFGLDPQARLDYGYQAVATLTPMAKALIEHTYGSGPEYSYMAGSSNGGRHTMVGASRYTEEYDGFLAVAPGFNLPQAATAQLWGAQQWETVATSDDLNSALTPEERTLVADAILEQCDALDGAADGMVFDSAGCQEVFEVAQHVPTCDADRDGTCLTPEQQDVITNVFNGATTSNGSAIYAGFPYDPGMSGEDWGSWKFEAPISRDSVAVGYIFSSPPYAPDLGSLRDFVLDLDIDEANESIYATSGQYTESAMDFMTPPDLEYQDLKASGGKMIVIHGASDGVFSMEDTSAWYRDLQAAHGGDASDFVQYYEVPGMNHTRGGPSTDQHNSLTALTDWVEHDQQPQALDAWVNPDNDALPANWSSNRSRPLCAYPQVALYTGGDIESASSFECGIADAPVELDPQVTVDSSDVQPGETITITATGYTPEATVTMLITDAEDQQIAQLADLATDAEGALTTTWQVPDNTQAAELTITVTDDSDPNVSASTVVTVIHPTTEPSPSATDQDPSPSETAPADPTSPTATSVPSPSPDIDADTESDEDSLALTGAGGIALLIASAILLLLVGTIVMLYVRKRRAHQ